MNLFGHILIWFIALGAMAASVLTAKTFEVRNSWIRAVEDITQKTEANKLPLEEKRKQLRDVKNAIQHATIRWDRLWPQVGGGFDNNFVFQPQDAGISAWLGAIKDPAEQQNQILYVFKPQQDGSSVYLGSFKYDSMLNGFAPTWAVRSEDNPGSQNLNAPFRVRTMVRSQSLTHYVELRGEIIVNERLYTDKLADMAALTERKKDAQSELDKRTNELAGPNGLVEQLQKAEDARDVQLEELDYWRRQVNDAQLELRDITIENLKLEQELKTAPTAEPETPAKVTLR